MNALTIQRWRTSYRAHAPLDPLQRAQLDGCLDQIDLSREIDALVDGDELVFIRRLHLSTRLGSGHGAAQAADLWRRALLAALCQDLDARQSNQASNVVRFRRRRDAVCDMLYRACCRDPSRDWVWRQMDLLPPGAHDPQRAMRRALRELLRDPAAIWPALAHLIASEAHTGALTLLLREMPAASLDTLLLACPQTAPYQRAVDAAPPPDDGYAIRSADPLVRWLLDWSRSHPTVSGQARRAVTVLLAAAACPAASSSGGTGDTPQQIGSVLAASRRLAAGSWAPAVARAVSARATPSAAAPVAADAAPRDDAPQASATEHGEELPAPPLGDSIERVPTDWGGLLFLLHLLPAAGLHDRVAELADFGDMPPDLPQRVLWHLASAVFGIPPGDPAVRAFCGGWQPDGSALDPSGALRMPGAMAMPGELLGHRLRTMLAERLPGLSLPDICLRPGMLHIEPGWIELHLPLRCASTDVRRAALDLDPGWLPWLGCVVRFVYE